jgi:AraC-like DNA-binding protein
MAQKATIYHNNEGCDIANYSIRPRLASGREAKQTGIRTERGPFESTLLRPGLELLISNQTHPNGMKIGFEIEKSPVSLSCNLSLPIRATMIHDGHCKTVLERNAGDCVLAYLPRTGGITESPPGHLTGLNVFIDRPVFRGLFTELPDQLKAIDRDPFGASRAKPFHHRSPIRSESRFVIQQIAQCPYQGDTRRIFLEAKVLELVALKLAELGHMDPEGESELSRRELDGAREAYHILLSHIEQPPSLQDLSLMVGMNRNKLNKGFKQLFGGTAFKVLRDARLAKAWSLLRDTDSSLTEIALSVGYSDQANFSNAFRRHFGQTPNLVRQKSLDSTISY